MKYAKITFLFFVIALFTNAQERPNGIGLRVGDPLGVTYKKYGSETSYEFILGRSLYRGDRLYAGRYSNVFYRKYDKGLYIYNRSEYTAPLSISFHYLKNYNITSVAGLYWYFGGGPQIKIGAVNYYYYDYYGVLHVDRGVQFDFGINGLIGLEYAFQDAPLSLFADLGINMEFWDLPFAVWGLGGFGGRFRF